MVDNKKNNDLKEREYNISFEKRKKKQNIKKIIKVFSYIISLIILSTILAEVIVYFRNEDTINNLEEKYNTKTNDYEEIINEIKEAVVTISDSKDKVISQEENSGNISGVIIHEDGFILTSYSKIKDMEEIIIKIPESEDILEGDLLTKNENLDLAVVEVTSEKKIKAIEIVEDTLVEVGQEIVVIGNNKANNNVGHVTKGIIKNKNEVLVDGIYSYTLVQVSTEINDKNIGGAICNLDGELIGIASDKFQNKYGETYFGIDINLINSIQNKLGILDGGMISGKDDFLEGFYVKELQVEGNAYVSGIKTTDIILKIDNLEITNMKNMMLALEDKNYGDTLVCDILRTGEPEQVLIEIN